MARKKSPPVEAPPAPTVEMRALRRRNRARKAFRALAEQLNPSPFVPVYDSHGRLRHAPRHVALKA